MKETRRRCSLAGQAMVEFALVAGLFVLVIGGVMQFAAIVWSQHTINQVTRDTARWAVTNSAAPCDSSATRADIADRANKLADEWSLMSHATWGTASAVDGVGASGVGVDWQAIDPPVAVFPSDCPPSDNRIPWVVTVRVNHTVPLFVPGLDFITGSCAAPGFCISSTAELRMEPKKPI